MPEKEQSFTSPDKDEKQQGYGTDNQGNVLTKRELKEDKDKKENDPTWYKEQE